MLTANVMAHFRRVFVASCLSLLGLLGIWYLVKIEYKNQECLVFCQGIFLYHLDQVDNIQS
jgi:hypothetical protein